MAEDIETKRAYVTNLYPGKKGWANKVRHMSDIQVIAIYLRSKKAEANQPKPDKETEDDIPF